MTQRDIPVPERRPTQTLSVRPIAGRAQAVRPTEFDPLRRLQRAAGNQAIQRFADTAMGTSGKPAEANRDSERGGSNTSLQRRCACGGAAGPDGECTTCRARRLSIQRQAIGPGQPAGVSGSVIAALELSGGQPLDCGTRTFMERAFGGISFEDVRLHTGSESQQAARDIQAKAFTHGQNIHFAVDEYRPRTMGGQKLLAHELTHTVQQKSGMQRIGSDDLTVSQPDEPQEYVADRVAGAITAGDILRGVADGVPNRIASIQRQTATPVATTGAGAPAAAPSPDLAATAVQIALAVLNGDVSAAVIPLRPFRNRPLADIVSLRVLVQRGTGLYLEHWLVERLHRASSASTTVMALSTMTSVATGSPLLGTATELLVGENTTAEGAPAEEGLRLLWRALPLIDRLEIYDEGYREIEQAQLDVIRASSAEERVAARAETTRLDAIYAAMDAKEEYDARTLIDSTTDGLYSATSHLLRRARESPGFMSHVTGTSAATDALYDAILALPLAQRRTFFDEFYLELNHMLYNWQFLLISTLARGSEVQALIARLRLATEGRTDDQAAVTTVVDRAVALLSERRQLRAAVAAPGLPATDRATVEARLQELSDLDELLQFYRPEGEQLQENTFMQLVSSARGESEAFSADAQRLAQFAPQGGDRRSYAFQVAKQRILLAGGDADTISAAVLSLHAPPVKAADLPPGRSAEVGQWEADVRFRQELLSDPVVSDIVGGLHSVERGNVLNAVQGDAFNEVLSQANQAYHGGRYGDFFKLILRMARDEGWRGRFQRTSTDPFGLYANVSGDEREIMETILRTQHMPLADVLSYSGDVDLLREALGEIPEEDRARLRLGWTMLHDRPIGPMSLEQEAAMRAYQDFEGQVRRSQTSRIGTFDAAGFESVLRTTLGSEPTAQELATPEGRYHAAALMFERLEAQLRLERGIAASFTETDETMDASGREFAALWVRVRDQHTLSMVDFAALSALYQRFEGRAQEFTEANNAIGEMAGMIAATVAGIVVVAATGGAATPGVIALAAASGAGARVVTREMFGGDYYHAMSDQGARDAFLGAVDAALAVVSGSLAARGTELLGLGGQGLTSSAARIAGEVTEQATQSLSRRVIASSVESALDGAFSGAVGEAFGVMTDARTWRRGIMDGLARVGQAALIGGLAGLGGGAVMGAAMPIVGRGTRYLWNAAVGQSLENTLTRAGVSDVLTAAREAARAGRLGDVNELAARLEMHLAPQEAAALREQLYADLRQVLGHPPGTSTAALEARGRLLAESGALEEGLNAQQLEAETYVVARSEPQPSREPGYVDEVDLGNGHSWRRREDGTWCRFTKVTLCGTDIPGALPLPAAGRTGARRATELERHAQHEEMRALLSSFASEHQIARLEQLLERAEDRNIVIDLAEVNRALRSHTTSAGLDAVMNDMERNISRRIQVGQEFEAAATAGSDVARLPGSSIDEGFYLTEQLRNVPGQAHGGEHLSDSTRLLPDGRHGPFPGQIARRMRNMHFDTFADFRETFWQMVAEDPVLGQGWTRSNLTRMRGGQPPIVGSAGGIYQGTGGGANRVLQLNHIRALKNAGGVYDLENIEIVTPLFHGLIGD